MKKKTKIWLTGSLSILILFTSITAYTFFVPNTQTAYAATFVQKCDGQQWFIDEVERLLNIQEKTIDTLASQNDLDHIVTFGMQGQGISGTIPRALGEFRNLKHIFLANNELSGGIPAELGNLAKLENLDLSNNNLTGAIPEELGNLANLEVLLLWNNDLSGAIPEELGSLAKLRNLDLADNGLSGGIPTQFGGLTNLEFLSVSNNPLEGAIPAQLGNLTKIRGLLMWNCGLTGTLPAQLGSLAEAQILDLAHNSLEGTIPASFGQLAKLQRLSLRDNALSGILPAELGTLADLRILDIPDNQFTGGIPAAYGALSKLELFAASNNQLSGNLPPELGALTALTTFDVGHNSISGGIPASFSAMTALREFLVNNNIMDEQITDIFSDMQNLSEANLSNNKFVSDVPYSLRVRAEAGTAVNVDSNYLAGEQVMLMASYADNFVDIANSRQNVMKFPAQKPDEAPELYILPQDETINLYDLFYTVNSDDGLENTKPKLGREDYSIFVLDDENEALDIQTANGYSASTYRYIDQDEPVIIKYGITANNGLPRSTGEIRIASQYEAGNRSPVANNVRIEPAEPGDGDTLTVLYEYTDRENDPEGETAFIWKKQTANGWEVISGATGQTYTVPAGSAGEVYRAEVIVRQSDGQTNGFRFWSDSVTIGEQQGEITVEIAKADDLVTISGSVTDGSDHVVLYVTSPSGQAVYIGAAQVSENAYSVSFRIKQPIETGTYDVKAKSQNMAAPLARTFTY